MPGVSCLYKNCINRQTFGSNLGFFNLPKDERRAVWIKHSGNASLNAKLGEIKFCENHFYDADVIKNGNRKRLTPKAIPKSTIDVCKCTESFTDKLCFILGVSERGVLNEKRTIDSNGNFRIKEVKDGSTVFEYCTSNSFSNDQSDKIEWVYNKIPEQRKKLAKIDETTETKNLVKNLMTNETDQVKTFVMCQLFHKTRGRFTFQEKELFLKYYYKSPSLYKEMLSDGFKLPSISTISNWHSDYSLMPGITAKAIHLLRTKCNEMEERDRNCVLIHDEMAVKKELELKTNEDVVYGFQDFGEFGRENIVVNKVYTMMIRGLNRNWKQTFAYYVGSPNGVTIKKIIENALEKLTEIGFKVKGFFLLFYLSQKGN